MPFVAKDTMNVAGLPTTAGWHVLSSKAGGVDLIPERDACVVMRMRLAGAVRDPDPELPITGVAFFSAPTEEVEELLASDPARQAGLIATRVVTWMCPKGLLA